MPQPKVHPSPLNQAHAPCVQGSAVCSCLALGCAGWRGTLQMLASRSISGPRSALAPPMVQVKPPLLPGGSQRILAPLCHCGRRGVLPNAACALEAVLCGVAQVLNELSTSRMLAPLAHLFSENYSLENQVAAPVAPNWACRCKRVWSCGSFLRPRCRALCLKIRSTSLPCAWVTLRACIERRGQVKRRLVRGDL